MSIFGIVCEFNPLHNGHKRLMDEAKRLGADAVVCAMSGNAVQRGELAVVDKYARAKAAVLCGADLVLELPYPWSASSAEYFSGCGIELLSHFCDSVIFGSECGDIALLKRVAGVAASSEFKERFKEMTESGEGAARAYFALLEERVGAAFSSNDILGIEYIRSAIEKNIKLDFYTVKREGAAYNCDGLTKGEYPSATAIRKAWGEGKAAEEFIPEKALEVFEDAEHSDDALLHRALMMYFRLADPKSLEGIAETDGGIVNRIVSAAKSAKNGEDFLEQMRTKRYTDAKLRRAMLFCLTEVRRELLKSSPEYVTLLAADSKGRELLARARKDGGINIVTKPADAPRESEQFKVGERLEAIFTLSLKNSTDVGESYRKNVFIN